MTRVMMCDCRDDMRKKTTANPARTMLNASFAAQSRLVNGAGRSVIPAVAESPIPVLAPRNRTPDPRTAPETSCEDATP